MTAGSRRIAILTHTFVESDARVTRQVETFVGAGWAVDLLALDDRKSEGRLRSWRVPMRRMRGNAGRYMYEYGLFFVWSFVWIAWRCLRARPDVIYVNSMPDFLVFSALPARLLGVPVTLDVHDPMPELFHAKGRSSSLVRRLLELQERWSVEFADRVITVHEPMKELLCSRTSRVDIDIVMNVPDWPIGEPRRVEGSRTVVFAGSMAVRYGLDDLLHAMANSSVPKISLLAVGEGEDQEELAALASSLGVEVTWAGRVPSSEVRRHLANAWAGFNGPKPHPAGNLSFSNKVVESVAFGLPVIASRIPTLQRYFSEDTLIYFEPGSREDLTRALDELDGMTDTEVRSRVRRSQEVLESIAWPRQEEELLRVVIEAVEG